MGRGRELRQLLLGGDHHHQRDEQHHSRPPRRPVRGLTGARSHSAFLSTDQRSVPVRGGPASSTRTNCQTRPDGQAEHDGARPGAGAVEDAGQQRRDEPGQRGHRNGRRGPGAKDSPSGVLRQAVPFSELCIAGRAASLTVVRQRAGVGWGGFCSHDEVLRIPQGGRRRGRRLNGHDAREKPRCRRRREGPTSVAPTGESGSYFRMTLGMPAKVYLDRVDRMRVYLTHHGSRHRDRAHGAGSRHQHRCP